MSGHGANPIFFNKKNKDWTSRILAKPPRPTSDNISFFPPPPPHSPSKWTSYVYHPLTRSHLNLVKDLYTEPTEDRVAGNLFNFVMALPPTVVTPQAPVKRKTKSVSTTVSRNLYIREMFAAPKENETPNVIVVDDD